MPIVRAATGSSSAEVRRRPGLRLPPEMLEKAADRICYITLICVIVTVFVGVTHAMLQPESAEIYKHSLVRLTNLGIVLLSAAFVALQRSGLISKQTVLYLGAAFQVLIAFAFSLLETSLPSGPATVVRGVSGVALWIALCGLVIPNTPLANLLAGIFSVLSWPLAYVISRNIFHFEFIGWNRMAMWMLPLTMTAVIAFILNRSIYAMRVDSQKAEELGSYKLDYMIGQGGMGEVWRAKHRMLARDAAVKLIRPEVLAGTNMRNASLIRKRFEREARATASLRSPHTVALYDFGLSQDGSFYYVMELLDGIDLQTMVEKFGPLPASRVRSILVQVCESLEEAHTLGMVHRDIKPRNIFLSKLGRQHDFAKVLDFGLVKNLLQSEDTLATADGATTGTPAYMAPEVALASDNVDGRADLYALGCVAYYLMTGQMVFQESGSTATVLAHVQKTPVPPSERTDLPIPQGLERIVMQCLAKNPDDRPQTAGELSRRLEALTDVPKYCRDSAAAWWDTHLPGLQSELPVALQETRDVLDSERHSVGA